MNIAGIIVKTSPCFTALTACPRFRKRIVTLEVSPVLLKYASAKSRLLCPSNSIVKGRLIHEVCGTNRNCERGFLDEKGRVKKAAIKARERGVIFDLSHGNGNFSFDIARTAMAQGFDVDMISTDLHKGSYTKAPSSYHD